MRLVDLDPRFLRYERDGQHVYHRKVETMAEAQGVMFLCPKCFESNGGRRGTHMVVCWSEERGTPLEATPGPGRWALRGTGFHDLTLDGYLGRSRSVALMGGCAWHGFITNGEATSC
jgi:hypothetical protein